MYSEGGRERLVEEATQVAAMGIRFLLNMKGLDLARTGTIQTKRKK